MTAVVEEAKVSDSLLLWDVTLPVTVRYNCSWTVSAERVTPQKRNYPSSLVPLSENRQNFVLSRIKRSRNI